MKQHCSVTALGILFFLLFQVVGTTATAEPRKLYPEIAKEIVYEGSVLLENRKEALPLISGTRLAIFGINQVNYVKGGGGSADSRVPYVRDLLYGLEQKEKEGKVVIYKPLSDFYRNAFEQGYRNANEPELNTQLILEAKNAANVAIVAIGRFSEEGSDRFSGRGDYLLSPSELNMLRMVTAAGFEKVIVVLNIGSVIDSSWYKDNLKIDAVLLSWQAGMEAGNAIADLLIGDAYPSGKLVDTFAKRYDDYPSSTYFKESAHYTQYQEDIYVGYRYFETMAQDKVNYEFGYGLGYTSFEVNGIQVRQSGKNIVVKGNVKNTGSGAGKEVIQVYYSAPQGKMGKPAKELIAYIKTKELLPGESENFTLSFPVNEMASYDDIGHVVKSAFILEEGDYRFFIGNSVRNIREADFRYHVSKPVVTEQLSRQLTPKRLEYRLLADGSYEKLPTLIHHVTKRIATQIEMEDYKECDSELRVNNFRYPYGRRGESLSGFNAAGRWVEYDLEVTDSGYYNVTWTAANAKASLIDAYQVLIDGVEQPNAFVDLLSTGESTKGEWNDFALVAPFNVYLGKGRHSLRFVSKYEHVAKLDYMLIESSERHNALVNRVAPAKKTEQIIMLQDVERNYKLMPQFMAQIPDRDLFALATGTKQTGQYIRTESFGDKMQYGIPNIHTTDGPSGVYIWNETTGYPNSTMLACAWNLSLCDKFGKTIANECIQYGIDIILAPGANLHRDPLCGRNFEYYSEDPYISGKTAAAVINGVQSENVGVSLKHFAVNDREDNRRGADSRVSERALREIYLKGFEIAVKESQPWTIMDSYNPINGTKATENAELLLNILRDEWGYKGLVISDWDTTGKHHLEAKAGTDIKMPFGVPGELRAALDNGLLTRAELERNLENFLRIVFKTNAYKRTSK